MKIARTRASHPMTSHRAAESLSDHHLRESQAEVLRVFVEHQAQRMSNPSLVSKLTDSNQSEQSIRSRRSELEQMGYVVNAGVSGERTRSGRAQYTWSVTLAGLQAYRRWMANGGTS